MPNFFPREKMDYKTANLVHILATVDASAIVSITGMPNSIKTKSSGFQHALDLIRKKLQFNFGERHAEERKSSPNGDFVSSAGFRPR